MVAEGRVLSINDIKLALELVDSLFGALDMGSIVTGIPDAYKPLKTEVSIIPQ
jgi:hypothetical protein